MGLGGGITRDVLCNQVPAALKNPAYTTIGVAWWSAGISFAVGYTVRVTALYRGWEEPLAKEPAGVYKHDDRRPLLGRKLRGKSQRELKELGLVVEEPTADASR